MSTTDTGADAPTTAGTDQPLHGRRARGDLYDYILRTVYHNIGPDRPPGASVPTVAGSVVREQSRDGERSITAFRSRLSAALDNGDLIEWYDADGTRRLTTTDTGSLIDVAERGFPGVDGDAADVLRSLAAHHAERDDPNAALIGAINAALAEVRE